MGKYTPLSDFLRAQDEPLVVMSFVEIEQIIGERLPERAQTLRAWWREDVTENLIAQAWRDAGFKPVVVDMDERGLAFRRVGAEPSNPANGTDEQKRPALFGGLKGLMTIEPGVDLTEPADPEWGRNLDREVI